MLNLATSNIKNTKTKSNAAEMSLTDQQKGETPEDLKSDLLDDFLFHAANYIYIRRKLFIAIAVVILTAIGSVYGGFRYIQYRDNMRNETLFAIEQKVFDASLSDEERFKSVMPILNTFIDENPDTRQQIIALFYRSNLNYQKQLYSEAEADLKDLLSYVENQSELFVLASLHLSNVLREQKKYEEALEILTAAKTDLMTDIILMEQVEVYIAEKKNDMAKQTLQILLQDYPKSLYANKAKQLMEML